MSRIATNYTVTWSSGIYTITYSSVYPSVTFSDDGYIIQGVGSNYFYMGQPDSITMLDYTKCTSPTGASRSALITAIQTLASSGGSTFGAITLNGASNQLIFKPSDGTNTISLSASQPTANRVYTVPDVSNDADFLLTEGNQTVNGSKTFSNALAVTPTTNQMVFGTTRTITMNYPTPATSSRTITFPDPGANANVVLSESDQTINGTKSFSGTLTLSDATTARISAPNAGASFIISAVGASTFLVLESGKGSFTFGLGSGNTFTMQMSAPASSRVMDLVDMGANSQLTQQISTTHTTALTANGTVSSNVNFPLRRIGDMVIFAIPTISIVNGAGSNTFFSINVGIPTAYRPASTRAFFIRVQDNVSQFPGLVTVDSSGAVFIYKLSASTYATTAFTGSVSIGCDAFTCSWIYNV